jgi:hypothetical protein
LATAIATSTAAAAAVVKGNFPQLGAEEVTQSMRACLGLARGPKVALGRLSATLGLRTRKVGKGKGKANQSSGHGRKNKDHKNNVQKRNNDKHKVIFCLQIVFDIPRSRDWLFQAQVGAKSGIAFCNRFTPLEGNGEKEEEADDDEEEKVALVPSAAKEARWRKWRPRTRARASQSSRGADQLFDWDTLAPVGAAASPSVSYPRIANTDMCVCVCVCVAARMFQWEPFCSRGQRPISAPYKANALVVRSSPLLSPTSSSASRFHFLTLSI